MTARPRRPTGEPDPGPARRSGRHPEARRTVVRFTDPAFADLQRLARKGDPQVVRWALKKCLLPERNPAAGEEPRGGLDGEGLGSPAGQAAAARTAGTQTRWIS